MLFKKIYYRIAPRGYNMLETINKNQVNLILNKNTDEIATLIEKHRNIWLLLKK